MQSTELCGKVWWAGGAPWSSLPCPGLQGAYWPTAVMGPPTPPLPREVGLATEKSRPSTCSSVMGEPVSPVGWAVEPEVAPRPCSGVLCDLYGRPLKQDLKPTGMPVSIEGELPHAGQRGKGSGHLVQLVPHCCTEEPGVGGRAPCSPPRWNGLHGHCA